MANTLGACFHRYECEDGRGQGIIMDLWDTAGQQKFRSLLTLYYKNSDAVVIVFDVTEPNSFKTVDYWAKQIETNCETMPCKQFIYEGVILVGNKIDRKQPHKGVSSEEIQRYLLKKSKW